MMSGYMVPSSTVAQATSSNTLFMSSSVSRDMSRKLPPPLMALARQANSVSAPPTTTARKARMNTPRAGSVAKACTDTSTPERTRNVPSRLKEKPKMASSTVHALKAPRCSLTASECINAVATSHGMNEAFSTGSQNHQPPQPSSL